MANISPYYEPDRIRQAVDSGDHRKIIGGLWDEMGVLQLQYLKAKGLRPGHRLVDVGCGSLRAGVHLADYLGSGNYYGTDINAELIEAGYERELRPLGLDSKVPRTNFHVSGGFDFSWVAEPFDFALAQSLFTHLPYNHLKLALANIKPALKAGGRMYASFFVVPDTHPAGSSFAHPKGITSQAAQDPYHFHFEEIALAARLSGWVIEGPEDWNHPRDQVMVCFTNTMPPE